MTTASHPVPDPTCRSGAPIRRFERLGRVLASDPSDLLIERVDEIGSTSTALLERPALVDTPAAAALGAGATAGDPSVGAVWLIAGHQTGGRGRRGRQWRSDPGASLAASLAIEAALPAEPGALTLVAGAAVARTLLTFGARPGLKWPNDVYLQRPDGELAKAGGILCESRMLGGTRPPVWRLVVGCGLNLFPATVTTMAGADTAAAIPPSATAGLEGPPPGHLFDHADPVLRERLELALGVALAKAISAALRIGPEAGLADWKTFDLLAGQRIRIHGAPEGGAGGPPTVTEAIARGIDGSGRLLVSDAADPDRCRALIAEEVSIRRLAS